MRIADDSDCWISDRQTVGTEEQRVPLVAARCRGAQSVDVLSGRAHSGNCDLRSGTAVHETGADDDARRIANHVSAFSFVRAKSFQQIEDLSSAKIGDLAAVAAELHAE